MARKKRKEAKPKPPTISQSAKPAGSLFRLIPLTMLMAFGLLAMKVSEIVQDGQKLHEALLVGNVLAEEEKKKEEEEPVDTEATPDEEEHAASDEKKKEGEEEAAKEEEGHGEKKEDEHAATSEEDGHGEKKEGEEAAPPAPPPVDMFESKKEPFTEREVDILQSLAQRREKLDAWEKEIALREKLLEATQTQIDTKLVEMQTLSDTIQKQLVVYKEEENVKIRSLVKVYESMKPKDAARIFDELDMDVLLMVVDRMSERRVAPILAGMSPQKAKDVTQQLADQRKTTPVPEEAPVVDPKLPGF